MASSYEQRLLVWLQRKLVEHRIGQGEKRISVEDVHLEKGESEGEMVVILFREVRRLRCVFGFRMQAREPGMSPAHDESPEGWGEVIFANLQEHVEAADMGLPKDCDPNSITWI
jgi:hypothetical protein